MVVEKKPGLLIFDLDDTLVHSKIDFARLGQWIREQIIAYQIVKPGGEGLDAMSVSQMLHLAQEHDVVHGTNYAKGLWKRVEDAEMEGVLRATVEENAQEILAELKNKDYLLSIFTNNSSLVAETVLEKFYLASYIDKVVTRDEVKYLKPNPEGLLLLKESFEKQVEKIFYIGDSWIDGLAANRAGIPFIGFNCLEPREIKMIKNISGLAELAVYLDKISDLGSEENAV